MLGSLTGAVGF